MKQILKYPLFLLIIFASQSSYSQTDTNNIINDFAKVMGFASQSDIFYNTNIIISSVPVMKTQDTMNFSGIFYKKGENIYSQSGNEEIFMQDGFLIQINKERKSIWISKTDENIKEELTQKKITKQVTELFRNRYNIEKTLSGSVANISFNTKSTDDFSNSYKTKISLQYDIKNFLPKSIVIELILKEEADDEQKAALISEGVNVESLLQKIDGKEFFVRSQKMTLSFDNISTKSSIVQAMPTWKSYIKYDETKRNFMGIGIYSGYAITKLF